MKRNYRILTFFLFIFLTGIGILIGFKFSENKIERDKVLLESKLNELFNGKIAISDGNKFAYEGEFVDNKRMHYEFLSGGFTIYELVKESGGFVKIETNSDDLYFKKAETEFVPAWYSNGWKVRDSYTRNNNRTSVQNCYDRAYEYMLKGDENDRKISYTPDKLTDIKNFPSGFNSRYYFTEHKNHPSEFYYTHTGSGKFYTGEYELNYNQEKTFFAISENEYAIKRNTILNSSIFGTIGLVIAIFISVFLKKLIPHKGKHNDILNKKWKNLYDNTILTIHSKTFGKYPVTLVEENIPIKGNAKINGNLIEIYFLEVEFYYQIENKEKDILEMVNLSNDQLIVFERLGSNAYTNRIKLNKEKNNDEIASV